MDWQALSAELRKPLDTAAVKPPAPGKYGDYVDGYHIITEANRVFGHGGWSYIVTRLERTSGQVFELTKGPQYRCSFLCAVRVTVGDVVREGVAVGNGSGRPENMADAIESAVKEAETDALKRALRSFGNTFGLALYEKDHGKRQVGDPDAAADAVARIAGAQTGRDLLVVVAGLDEQTLRLDAVVSARLDALRRIIAAAPTTAALDALAKAFGPDWPRVSAQAQTRRNELNERNAA
jgi:DNA repair and recombination protein RAD52